MARVARARREKVDERQAQRTASAAAWEAAEAAGDAEGGSVVEADEIGLSVGGAGGGPAPPPSAANAEELARVSRSARPNSCAARSRWPAALSAWAREAKAGAESGFSCGEWGERERYFRKRKVQRGATRRWVSLSTAGMWSTIEVVAPFLSSRRATCLPTAGSANFDENRPIILTTSLAEERCAASAASRADAESGNDAESGDNERRAGGRPAAMSLVCCSWTLPPVPDGAIAAAAATPAPA